MYYPQVRKRRTGFIVATIGAAMVLVLFVVYATSRIVVLAGPIGADATNLRVDPECQITGGLLEAAGTTNPTVSTVLSGAGERMISCDFVTLKGASKSRERKLVVRVKDCDGVDAALRYYFAKLPTMREVKPLEALGGQAVESIVQLDAATLVTIIVQDGNRFVSVQYDGSDKGFFGMSPAVPEEASTVALEVARRFVSA
jgi:hypothetical protein